MFLRYLRDRLPFGNKLPIRDDEAVKIRLETGAEPWHAEAIIRRAARPHVSVATRWLAEALPAGARVFEPGCGSGVNLFWLGLNAGHTLYGADISEEALAMGKRLAAHFNYPAEFWKDDGLAPARLPQDMDAILSVNWLYHIPNVSLEQFLSIYRPALKMNGLLAFDMVTRDYDRRPGNQWHTQDRQLPEGQRRPSEYRIRMDREEIACVACRCGFALLRGTRFLLQNPQRAVYLLRRVS